MIFVYLIYGLSFFILWTALMVYEMKLSTFPLAKNLWLIGFFGLFHGIGDWIMMLIVIQKLQNPVFRALNVFFVLISFYFLIQFAVNIIKLKWKNRLINLIPVLLLAALLAITLGSEHRFLIADIFSRYLLGVPGVLLTFYALTLQIANFKEAGRPGLVKGLKTASIAFLCFGFFTGLVVPEAGFFPASALNYRTFISVTGLPVEVFRALSILTIAFALTRALREFEQDIQNSQKRSMQELEDRVRARTEEIDRLYEELKQGELQEKAILDNIPDIAWLKDRESRFVRVNEAFARSAVTTVEKLIGKTDFDIWPKDMAARYRADDKEVMNSGKRKRVEEPLVDNFGNVKWIETIKTPVFNERGDVTGTAGIARDITERKRYEEAAKAEESFRKAIESSVLAGIVVVDLKGKQIYVNPAFCKMVGWTEEELTSAEPPFAYWPPEEAESIGKAFEETLSGKGRPEGYELRFTRRSGEHFDVFVQTSQLKDGAQTVIGWLASVYDITERKKAEEALRESENRYRAIMETALDAIITIDQDSRIIFANNAVQAIFGYTRSELEGESLTILMPERLRKEHRDAIRRYVATGKRHLAWGAIEMSGLHKDGREIPLEMSYGEFARNGKHFFTGIIRDITRRREAENALRESERLRQMIMDAVPALISYIGSDLRYRFVNHQYEQWWKRPASEIVGRRVKDVLGEEPYAKIEGRIKAALQGQSVSYDWNISRDREERYVKVIYVPHKTSEGNVLGFVTMINDITDLKRAQNAVIESEKRIQLVINAVPALISYVGKDQRYRFVNHRYEEWFSAPAAEITGKHVREMLGEEQYRQIEKFIKMALQGKRVSYERSLMRKNEIVFLHVDYVPHFGISREVVGFFTLVMDITGRKKIEQSLQNANERLSTVLNSITEAYYAFDQEWRIIEINREAEKILGPARDLLGRVYWEKFPQNLRTEIDRQYHRAIEEQHDVHFEARSSINQRWYELHAYPRFGRLEVYFRDITERKEVEQELERARAAAQYQAYHDALTSLPNRLLFRDILQVEAAQARRNRKKLSVLFLDLDRFKDINDTFGHDAGDELLKQVAGRLKKSIRQSDTVARIGGDEFNILLSDILDPDDVAATARKITGAFQDPYTIAGQELRVTTSIGIAIYPDDSKDIDTILKYADMAMYHAKERGRNRYQFYDQAINTRSLERMQLENALRKALEREEFIIYYLPQIDTRSRRVISAEALLRWRHPEKGLLTPEQFIAIAEETGLILPIGEWILRTVTRHIKVWQRAGLRPVPVVLNLSGRQFHQAVLPETATALVRKAGIGPDRIQFEISEETATRDAEFVIPQLNKLTEIGFAFSIDDYGTGCLPLNYLKKLSVQKIKIDQSLIRNILTDPDDKAIVDAMIAMSHSLSIKTVAEGVETEEQLKLLREIKCDEIQGYIFSEPQPAEEFEKLIASR